MPLMAQLFLKKSIKMKRIIMTLILLQSLHASVVTLEDVLHNAEQPKWITESIKEQGLALEAQNLAQTTTKPLSLNNAISQANSKHLSGQQYEVSFSKELKLGNIQSLEQEQNRLGNEAYLIEQEQNLIHFNNRLKNLYHQECLDKTYLNNFQEMYNKFVKLYQKKEKAYQHNEIAKTEMLQLELEKNSLKTELENLTRQEESSKKQLLSLTQLETTSSLSCQDIYPIALDIHLEKETFQLSQQAYEKRISSTQVGLQRYSKKIESIELSMGYTKELEQDIYTVGVTVPLNFTSDKSEQERVALMHQGSALNLENEQNIANKKFEVRALNERLSQLFYSITAQEENIHHYATRLLPLMKKSYDYGESSVIEYLLSQQKLSQLQQALLQQQKGYYATLFQLYTISETKDK